MKGLLEKKKIDRNWLDQVLEMRDDTEGAYSLFCDCVLSHVIGRDVWKKHSHTHKLPTIATVSDEAFAIFLLENSWEVWVAMAAKEGVIPERNYSVRGPGTKKLQGWTEEGIERFNKLFDMVLKNRTDNKGIFEEALMAKRLADKAGKKNMKKRPASALPGELPVQARVEVPTEALMKVRRMEKV
jgi:hypothetical protein